METIRINGVAVPIDSIEGPDGRDLCEAYRRHNAERSGYSCASAGPQGSNSQYVGVPRLQKHKGQRIAGIRIK